MPSANPMLHRSGARSRVRRRTATPAAAAALLCAFAACQSGPGEPDEPGEPRQVRTSFTVEIPSEGVEYGMFVRLDENPDIRGQLAGTVTFSNGFDVTQIIPTEATMDSERVLHVPADEVSDFDFYFRWSTFELTLEDQDGDGVLEAGTGHIVGELAPQNTFNDDFTAAPAGFPVTAGARRYSSPFERMAPWESLVIDFDQPVTVDQLQRFRVLADGQEVPGRSSSCRLASCTPRSSSRPTAFIPWARPSRS